MGVSAWERRLIFPIGRHSLMHVWVPDTLPPSLTAHGDDPAALAADVYQTLRLMNSGFEALNGWYRFIVLWRLRRLGLRETVTLEDYWNAVRRDDLNVLSVKVDAFAGLSLYARTGRLDLDEDDEVDEYRQGS
jgi:hypothetical protein